MRVIFERLMRKFFNYQKLKKNNFVVNFEHEGHVKIKLPKLSIWDIIWAGTDCIKNLDYQTRSNYEALLRKTIFELYENKYISRKASIIDIGCYIADNSLVWAKALRGDAIVFAIEPSGKNLAYGKKLADLNNIKNVKWVEAVCIDKEGVELDFDSGLQRANTRFKPRGTSNRFLVSTTLDRIVEDAGSINIGFVHVDVEGLEMSVLMGARELIAKNKPTISFEQHISREDVSEVACFLKEFGYRVFMVNEVLPGCSLDCRNFLAFDSSKGLPNLMDFDQKNGRDLGISSATIGPRLIEI